MRGHGSTISTKHGIGGKLRHLVLGGTLAALLALGVAGAGVAGDPSQWGAVAGDPSQWGMASRPTTTNDPQTALNFTKIEYKNSALNFPKVEFEYKPQTALNFTKIEF